MPKIVRLSLSGALNDGDAKPKEDLSSIDKPAMLVYTGEFESMDGPVSIKDEDIEKLAANHNGFMAKLSRLASGEVHPKHNPPVQLDHSTSARDTIGRLVGNLSVGEHTDEAGNKVKCLLGTARILGKENVERVQDGRWTHLSGGFDLETHKVTELTVTPFPAAGEASLLSQQRMNQVTVVASGKGWEVVRDQKSMGDGGGSTFKAYLTKPSRALIDIYDTQAEAEKAAEAAAATDEQLSKHRLGQQKYKDHGISAVGGKPGSYIASVREKGKLAWYEIPGSYETEKDALDAAKEFIDSAEGTELSAKLAKLSKGEGDAMPGYKDLKGKMAAYDKCKKHLMDKEKLSEEAVEERLAALSDEDVSKMSAEQDDAEKKLAAEAADSEAKEKAKKDEELKRMAALGGQKDKLVQLSKGMKTTGAKVQLAAKKATINARLSKLQAETKITPAERKTIKVEELAGKSDEVINAALSSYEKREPVIDVGLYGTTKALTAAQLQSQVKKLGAETAELKTRLAMPMKRPEALKRLADLGLTEQDLDKGVSVQGDAGGEGKQTVDGEAAYHELKRLQSEGKEDEAKAHFLKHLGAPVANEQVAGDQTEEISALAAEVKHMQTGFDDIVKLAAPLFGATAEELA